MKFSSITICLPIEIKKELEAVAKASGITVSDIVRKSLDRYLALRRFQNLREKVVPFAEIQGLFTDEDVFDALYPRLNRSK